MNIFNFLKNLFLKTPQLGGHGLIESPTDFRDVPLGAVKKQFTELPEDYKVPYKLKTTHQGLKPHCVGHAGAYIKAEKERRERNFIDFDPEWLYKECKKIDGIPNVKGTYFRAVLKVLKDKGAMPIGGGDPSKYRIGGYARIENMTFEGIKQAIYEYGTLLAGFHGSNNGWKDMYIRPPKKGESIWGHAVSPMGFIEKHIIFQNSWGDWGFDGYGYFGKDYFPFEIWAVLVDLPNNWAELIPDKKDKPTHYFREDLKKGMRGSEIAMLQRCLKYEGCFPDIEATGYFGGITLNSVICFQKKYNIRPPYGYVGPLTRSKLNELFN
jgi:hypothetical protein